MSLLTEKQIEEIQNFHDDIGECTEPHEECFIKKLIEWNEKQAAMPNQEVSAIGYLYKQKDCYGEIETVFSFDKPYITWHNVTDVNPVYLAPPKSEPFGPEIRERMSKAYNTKCEQIAFQEGIVFSEISHGIGVVE
jgi:hypothetical protein